MTTVRKRILANVRHKLSSSFIPSHLPRSPVPHLLLVNATPTDDERKLIHAAISEAENQMDQVLRDVAGNINVNEKKLAMFDDFIRTHRALLVPVRNLPPELLQEIFLLYMETSTGYHRWIRPPFILGQICRSWRQSAIALPALWDKLPAFKLNSSKTRSKQYCSFLDDLLNRSAKSETLRVYIRAPFHEIKEHPVIATLSRHAERIQTLTIESGVATAKAFLPMKEHLVNLEQLELAFWTKLSFDDDDEKGLVDAFALAPKLKRLSVMGRCPPRVTIPWETIEEYKERYDGGMVIQVLERCQTNLRTLEVVKNNHHTTPMIPPTTLESLKTLRVRLDDTSEASSRFLSNLTLPAIETAHVVFGGHITPILSTMFLQGNRSRTLRKLAFRGALIHNPSELRILFSRVPQLADLDIEVTDGDYDFLSIFIDLTYRPLVLPLLENLSITTISTSGMESVLNSIANARCERPDSDAMPSFLLDPAQMDFDLVQEVRPLQVLRINLPSREIRLASQASLNGWTVPTRTKQYRDTAKLKMWRKEIMGTFPSYFTDPEPGLGLGDQKMMKTLKQGKVPRFPERWDGILTEVAALDPFNLDSVSLKASYLHHTLRDITRAPVRYTMDPTNSDYIQRAQAITDNWKPIFSDLSEFRWTMMGSSSLLYVPSESSRRSSEDVLDKLVFGLKDTLSYNEVFWPQAL